MNTETLYDKAGNVLGYIEAADNGDETLTDADHKFRGLYEAGPDHTRDKHHDIVAKGNQLRSLIC